MELTVPPAVQDVLAIDLWAVAFTAEVTHGVHPIKVPNPHAALQATTRQSACKCGRLFRWPALFTDHSLDVKQCILHGMRAPDPMCWPSLHLASAGCHLDRLGLLLPQATTTQTARLHRRSRLRPLDPKAQRPRLPACSTHHLHITLHDVCCSTKPTRSTIRPQRIGRHAQINSESRSNVGCS